MLEFWNLRMGLYTFTVLFCCSILYTLCSASMEDCVKVSDTLKLELQTIVNCHVVDGNWTLVLGKSCTLNHWALSPAPAAKGNNLLHLYYTGICHILKVCSCYYFLQHLRTNKALQSHNSTGMVLCKSFNINLENGEVLLLETYGVPFHSHLQRSCEREQGMRDEAILVLHCRPN